jgi:hypothetical protein
MAKARKTRSRKRQGSAACIQAMLDRIATVASLADTAATLRKQGDEERAFDVVLDIEPLLHEADHLLQAASALRRDSR